MNKFFISLGNFFFRHRNLVFPLLMVAVLVLIRPQMPNNSYKADLLLDIVGVLVCLYGQLMRVLAIGYFYIKRGGLNKEIYAGRLVQTGFFAHTRNPLYLGNILIFVGIVIVFNSTWAYLVAIPAVLLIYWCIILAEEQFLRGKFGAEFDEYVSRVNRLWPNWRGYRKTIEDMTFRWRRVVSKEYGTTFGWLYAAVGIRIWTLYYTDAARYHREIQVLLAMFAGLFLLYALVRWMKKSGRLTDNDLATVDA